MLVFYVSIGGILGFLLLGPIGLLFGVVIGIALSYALSAEKKTAALENKIQKLEFKHNDDVVQLKKLIRELEEKRGQ